MMYDLLDDATAAFVNRICNSAPAGNLRSAVDARHVWIAVPLNADRGRFTDIQSRRGALCVICGIQ